MATSGKQIAAVRTTRKGATIYKTNERPGTRAVVRNVRVSAYKAREVLNLIRGKYVADADEILQFVERDIAIIIRKGLASAVANAQNNDSQDPEALFVSACYADEGTTMKRWRPRARGRATRIRKRTCHITIIVGRYSAEEWDRIRTRQAESGRATPDAASARARRVAGSRRRSGAADADVETEDVPTPEDELAGDEAATDAVVNESSAEAAEDGATAAGEEASGADADAAVTDEENAADEAATDAVVADDSAEIADEAAADDADATAAAEEADASAADGETDKKDED